MLGGEDNARLDPTDLARKFLDAYADIETILRRKAKAGQDVHGLRELISLTRNNDALVRKYEIALIAFSGILNAISHSAYKGGRPIAAPLSETVDEIARIRDQLYNPTNYILVFEILVC